jgi:hypothetical protein
MPNHFHAILKIENNPYDDGIGNAMHGVSIIPHKKKK